MSHDVGPAPEHRTAAWELGAGLVLLLWLLPFAWHASVVGDEWLLLGNARRITLGDWPHRDYFQFVPPLGELALAVPLTFWPNHPLSIAHVMNASLMALWAWGIWRLGQRLGLPPVGRLAPPAYLVCAHLPHWPVWSHHSVALAATTASMLAMTGPPSIRAWFFGGVWAGLTALAVQLEGALLVLVVAIWAAVLWRTGALGALRWRLPLAWLGGVSLPWLGFLGLLAWVGGLGAFLNQAVLWPWLHYKQPGGYNEVSLFNDLAGFAQGWPAWGAALRGGHAWGMLLLVLALVVVGAWMLWRGHPEDAAHRPRVLVVAVAWGGALAASVGRTDLTHLALFSVLTSLALLTCLWRGHRPLGGPLAALALVLVWGVALSGGAWQASLMRAKPHLWWSFRSPDHRLQQHPAWQWAQANLRPEDGVLAAPYGGYVYAWWGRPMAFHSILLPPSMGYLSPEDWEGAWAVVRRHPPRWLILEPCGDPKAYQRVLPSGYRWAASLASPLYGRSCPWVVYRWEGPQHER